MQFLEKFNFLFASYYHKNTLIIYSSHFYNLFPFQKRKYDYVTFVRRLRKEPDSSQYSDFHFYGTEYDSYESVVKGKILYHIPYVNGKKTSGFTTRESGKALFNGAGAKLSDGMGLCKHSWGNGDIIRAACFAMI